MCLILLDHARLYATENWTRPLEGEQSVLRTRREEEYFVDVAGLLDQAAVTAAAERLAASGCRQVGIDANHLQLEYPFQALLLNRDSTVHFTHVGVENASEKYRPPDEAVPCAVLCLACEGDADRINRYRHIGSLQEIGKLLLFLSPSEGGTRLAPHQMACQALPPNPGTSCEHGFAST